MAALRVVDGRIGPEIQAENDALELSVVRDEARAHVRRMRLVMQTRFWTDPEFRVLAKPLLTEIEEFARKFESEPERAA